MMEEQTPVAAEEGYKPSRFRTVLIVLFGVGLFLFFLALKLPEARIQNLVLAHLRIFAQDNGMLFSAEKVRLGMLLGPSVKIYNSEIKAIDDETASLKISYLRVRPHLLSLLSKTKRASIVAELGDERAPVGEISGTVGFSEVAGIVNLDLEAIDLGNISLLRIYLPLTLSSAKLDGTVKLDLDFAEIQKSEGHVKLAVNRVAAPEQSLYGFKLPKVSIGKAQVELSVDHGNVLIRSFEIGEDLKQDDIVAKVTGEGTLDRALDRSKVNVRAVFELSPAIFQSFPLLGSLLGPAEVSKGKYAYRLTGTVSSLEPVPGG